jgi:hypothetical protein
MSDSNNDGQPSADTRAPALSILLPSKPLFRLGQLLATPGALVTLEAFGVHPLALVIGRHVVGDWGDLCQEDSALNNHSLTHGMRIFSSYKLTRTTGDSTTTETVWVITEADRASTTILLPSEY